MRSGSRVAASRATPPRPSTARGSRRARPAFGAAWMTSSIHRMETGYHLEAALAVTGWSLVISDGHVSIAKKKALFLVGMGLLVLGASGSIARFDFPDLVMAILYGGSALIGTSCMIIGLYRFGKSE